MVRGVLIITPCSRGQGFRHCKNGKEGSSYRYTAYIGEELVKGTEPGSWAVNLVSGWVAAPSTSQLRTDTYNASLKDSAAELKLLNAGAKFNTAIKKDAELDGLLQKAATRGGLDSLLTASLDVTNQFIQNSLSAQSDLRGFSPQTTQIAGVLSNGNIFIELGGARHWPWKIEGFSSLLQL